MVSAKLTGQFSNCIEFAAVCQEKNEGGAIFIGTGGDLILGKVTGSMEIRGNLLYSMHGPSVFALGSSKGESDRSWEWTIYIGVGSGR
jgi:hypothetical protein